MQATQSLIGALNPMRYTEMSPRMVAWLQYLTGHDWGVKPRIGSATVTSDDYLIGQSGEHSGAFLGDLASLVNNVTDLARVIHQDGDTVEAIELLWLFDRKVRRWDGSPVWANRTTNWYGYLLDMAIRARLNDRRKADFRKSEIPPILDEQANAFGRSCRRSDRPWPEIAKAALEACGKATLSPFDLPPGTVVFTMPFTGMTVGVLPDGSMHS